MQVFLSAIPVLISLKFYKSRYFACISQISKEFFDNYVLKQSLEER